MSTGPGRRQSGQAIVLVALAMVAMLTMVALLLATGTAYADRRNLQAIADSAALAGALKIGPPTCSASLRTAGFGEAARVIGLGLGSGIQAAGYPSGSCGAGGYTTQYTYPGGYTATFNYPYNSNANMIMVSIVHTDYVRAFASFISPDQFNVAGRAVAQYRAGVPNGNFAVFAKTSVSCQGATTVQVAGSIYSNGAPAGNGACSIHANAVKDPNGNFLDYGNFITYADGFSWNCGHFCADGYEWAGHTSVTCGSTPSTQYMSGAQPGNPSPCSSSSPPAPNLGYPSFPDPNTSFPNGTPAAPKYSAPWAGCSSTATPSAPDPIGMVHFSPGCYDTISAPPNSILDPGFYYLGYTSAGQGICGNKNIVLGQDVTIEVANGDFNESNCGNLNSACNGCAFGADPASPVVDGAVSYSYFAAPDSNSTWCTGACPLKGLLIYLVPGGTGTFNVKGPAANGWFKGTIFWPSACVYHSNATGDMLGQFVCDTLAVQGGSGNGNGVAFAGGAVNSANAEAALIE